MLMHEKPCMIPIEKSAVFQRKDQVEKSDGQFYDTYDKKLRCPKIMGIYAH